MELVFRQANSSKDIKAIYDYTIDAFSDSPDFNWNLDEIKKEVKDGWKLMSVSLGEDIIAAIFYKVEGSRLLTKNTAIKKSFQGSGYSHKIKEFFEKKAKELKLKKVVHYCSIDNFRMYSLNESHGYEKTENEVDPEGRVVEWEKDLA